MEVYKRDEEGNPEKWRATVYFPERDQDLVEQIEDYADEHDIAESRAILEFIRNGEQLKET